MTWVILIFLAGIEKDPQGLKPVCLVVFISELKLRPPTEKSTQERWHKSRRSMGRSGAATLRGVVVGLGVLVEAEGEPGEDGEHA
jgi:hypothetical protein